MRVQSIKKVGIRKVRNLVVHGNHTFITENGIVTHNCDYLQANSTQPALRGFIEEFSNNCRFILTCNFKNRIIEPLQSRCSVYEFAIANSEKPSLAASFFKRLQSILDQEGVQYDPKVLIVLIEKHFPDWRRILNECQRYSISGKIDSGILVNLSDDSIKQLMKSLKDRDFKVMRKWVVDNIDTEPQSIFRKTYDTMYDYVKPESIPQLVLILADYSYKNSFVADHELNVVACMTEIMSSIEFK